MVPWKMVLKRKSLPQLGNRKDVQAAQLFGVVSSVGVQHSKAQLDPVSLQREERVYK